jgi:hypothetical protein
MAIRGFHGTGVVQLSVQRVLIVSSDRRHLMEIHLGIIKPGLDKANHLLIAVDTSELVEGVFKIDIFSVDAIGLVNWEPLIVLFENLDNVH